MTIHQIGGAGAGATRWGPVGLRAGRPSAGQTDAVRRFVTEQVRVWHHEPVPLPDRLVRILWALVGVDCAVGVWMFAVTVGKVSCTGTFCSISTLGGHQLLLGSGALAGAAILLALAPLTGALSRAGAPEIVGLGLAGLASVGAAIGVLALALMALSIYAVLVTAVLAGAGAAGIRSLPE